jgi:hypothetical protein
VSFHWQTAFYRVRRGEVRAPAITQSIFELCSAPCKALRFASTTLARGLRALTAPARSASMATT